MSRVHRIGIRDLVDHLLQQGDLSFEFSGPNRRLDAIRAHQRLQRSRPEAYQSEVSVRHTVQGPGFDLLISGRIDGVWPAEEALIVEEIKTTNDPPPDALKRRDPLHWGQLKCYAYLYALEQDLDNVIGQLTYYQLDTGHTGFVRETYTLQELADFFEALIDGYIGWAVQLNEHAQRRATTIGGLAFPFANYRPGQREVAVAAYRALRDGKHVMIQAATGSGKTMGVLFPALKALGAQLVDKVFYLTARTTGRLSAQQAVAKSIEAGAGLKSLTLTAKEKICFRPEAECDADLCEFARGYYDRLHAARVEAFGHNLLDRETLEVLARRHQVCPFEFSLELSTWADVIICDYNYAFDPRVFLRRFFSDSSAAYAFLVDEAHNLVDRARSMFSATIEKQPFLALRRPFKATAPELYQAMGRVSRWLAGARRAHGADVDAPVQVAAELPVELPPLLGDFARQAQRWLAQNKATEFRVALLELYFKVLHFLNIAEGFDEGYAVSYKGFARDLELILYCLDPAPRLQAALQRCRAAIFFSATLSPPAYFAEMLGCGQDADYLRLASPFPARNRCVVVCDGISTRLRARRRTAAAVRDALAALVLTRPGNYIFYFPSYVYMRQIYDCFEAQYPDVATVVQEEGMGEAAREAFVARFTNDQGVACTGFAVMGGIFAEGIDLVGERLSGVAIVGVGLPSICWQRELIRHHFNRSSRHGYPYAYIYPGINRVLQAAGRVIRSKRDRGVVLLIDDRYGQVAYKRLLPPEWRSQRLHAVDRVRQRLEEFWSRQDG